MKGWAVALLLFAPRLAAAEVDHAALAERALNGTILPGFERLAAETGALAAAAEAACAGEGPIEMGPVTAGYDAAFDAWIGVEAFRFGPAQEDNAGFALAFWPDTKGSTPRTLSALIAAEDPVVDDPAGFAELSVAARGLFALDWLKAHGLSLPRDVSVVGFDGVPESATSDPPLTTVQQPIAEIGRRAVRAILDHRGEIWRETLGVELVVRDSTAPPPERPAS